MPTNRPRILLYADGISYGENNVLLVKKHQIADVHELIDANILIAPKSIWSLSQNILEEEYLLFAYYVNYMAYNGNAEICHQGFSDIHTAFMFEWENLVRALTPPVCNTIHATKSIAILRTLLPNLLSQNAVLFDLLEKHIEQILRPHLVDGLFRDASYHERTDLWFHETLSINLKTEQYVRDLDTRTSLLTEMIRIFRPPAKRLLDRFNDLSTSDICDKMFVMSAYFGAMATHHYENDQYSVSVLSLHRALDLLLQSVAWPNNLFTEVAGHLRYNEPKLGKKEVNALDTFYLLKDKRIIVPSHDITEFVINLNRTRNLLQFAHAVYCCSKAETLRLIAKMERMTTQIDGIGKWKSLAAKFKYEPTVKLTTIFDTIPSIETYCKLETFA